MSRSDGYHSGKRTSGTNSAIIPAAGSVRRRSERRAKGIQPDGELAVRYTRHETGCGISGAPAEAVLDVVKLREIKDDSFTPWRCMDRLRAAKTERVDIVNKIRSLFAKKVTQNADYAALLQERNGYKNAYETLNAEIGQLRMNSGRPPVPPVATDGGAYTPIFHYDGLWTDPNVIHNHDFMRNDRYLSALRAGEEALGHDHKMYWRLHVALWAAERASHLQGAFVECGVWRGFLSTAIITYLDWNNLEQDFYLFDTFEGLIPELLSDKERQNADKVQHLNSYFKGTYPFVEKHFRQFPRVKLVPGAVPMSLDTVQIDKVAFLSLDMNCVGPEIAAANFFWPKMVRGAVILLDDYGFVSYEEQKEAFDAFAAEHRTTVLALPSGQGLIVKD
jgi:hypothetical protein